MDILSILAIAPPFELVETSDPVDYVFACNVLGSIAVSGACLAVPAIGSLLGGISTSNPIGETAGTCE